ncbi:MAG: hypothetical protein WA623_18145 [Candidatus Sulfotelmatobacter sp.]
MRTKEETPAGRLAIVKRDIPELEYATISDFNSKNQQCSEIVKKIPLSSPYFVLGTSGVKKLPPGWEHADFFYFSRVAFNREQTQALVNISFFSGTNGADSGGKYFLLAKKNGKWQTTGSSAVWQLTSR